MQQTGIETLQHVASSLGGLGRYGDTTLTIIMGDFNFVTEEKDRWNTDSSTWSGKKDELDADHWNKQVNAPNNLKFGRIG